MIRLIRVEIRRALSRHLVQRLVLAAVAAIVLLGVIMFLTTDPVPGGGDVKQPDPAVERAVLEECLAETGGDEEDYCRFVARQQAQAATGDTGAHVRLVDLPEVVGGTSFILFIAALAAAGSFVGAEWRFGTMAALLTWEPRRARVLLSKVAAAALVGGAIAIVLQLLVMLAAMPSVLAHGDTVGADAAFWRDTAGQVLRITAITELSIIVGFAIATVTRNAGAAIGGAFIWFAVLENILRGLRPGWNEWLLGTNAVVFLLGDEAGLPGRSLAEAGLYLLALSVAVAAAATLWFRRVDVQ